MIGDDHALTPGYVARHVPPGSRIGIDAAVLDIAQDFLLAHLAERGVLGDLVIFKGGTALRKLFAGAQGRFSTDMDLASREPEADRHALAEIIAGEAEVALGPSSPSQGRSSPTLRTTGTVSPCRLSRRRGWRRSSLRRLPA